MIELSWGEMIMAGTIGLHRRLDSIRRGRAHDVHAGVDFNWQSEMESAGVPDRVPIPQLPLVLQQKYMSLKGVKLPTCRVLGERGGRAG